MPFNKSMASSIKLYNWQKEALSRLRPGCILNGEVGSGKTLTGLVYYKMNYSHIPLVVITTPKKRDTHDWEDEAATIGITELTVDSWNRIGEYTKITDTFFIFDEQRSVGSGAWSKALIKIAKNKNPWIMLTGTPGDTWSDYITVFIANGFYKNKTEFNNQHVEFDRFARYPKIKAYHNQSKLVAERADILIRMNMKRNTERLLTYTLTDYDKDLYSKVMKMRFNPFKDNRPIKTPSELSSILRRIVSIDLTRQNKALSMMEKSKRLIVFYNYNYELDILRQLAAKTGKQVAEWNGHLHQEIPDSKDWIYIVQYTSGAEGWNCTETNEMLFYSPNYSYKIMEQAQGRIDRLNTRYKKLYYYFMQSASPIDRSVYSSIKKKKLFNASAWARKEVPDLAEKEKETLAGIRLSSGLNSSYSSAAR